FVLAGGLRFLRQAEGPLPDDRPLDLAGARVDRAGPAGQEDVLPGRDRVAVALGADQPVRAGDAEGDLAEALVVLAPEQLADGGLGARRAALGDLGQLAEPGEAHQLHAGPGAGQVLADQRVAGPAALAGGADQVPELPLVPQVRRRGPAAALVAEGGHGDAP